MHAAYSLFFIRRENSEKTGRKKIMRGNEDCKQVSEKGNRKTSSLVQQNDKDYLLYSKDTRENPAVHSCSLLSSKR